MEKRSNMNQKAILITFVGMLTIGTIGSVFSPKKEYSSTEKRKLQTFPKFSVKNLVDGKFEAEYENYVTDQFIFRNEWITMKTQIERGLQKKDINNVYFAKDNYLIERHPMEKVDTALMQKNLERLETFLNESAFRLGENRVRAMLVPTASEILTNKLPSFAYGFPQSQVIRELKEHVLGQIVVDVTDTLKEHAKEPIYYKTDHHWTSLGAYYAYVDWAKSMGFEPAKKEDFEVEKVADDFYGTIAAKVNVKTKPDDIYLYKRKGNPLYEVTYNEKETSNSLFYEESLKTDDKYTVFLKGNNPLVKIQTSNENSRKLLVIKDSFSHTFVPFLVDHYEEVYMIDFRHYKIGAKEFIEQEGITDCLVLYNIMNFIEDTNSLMFTR